VVESICVIADAFGDEVPIPISPVYFTTNLARLFDAIETSPAELPATPLERPAALSL
jgi:hypothetical protein